MRVVDAEEIDASDEHARGDVVAEGIDRGTNLTLEERAIGLNEELYLCKMIK